MSETEIERGANDKDMERNKKIVKQKHRKRQNKRQRGKNSQINRGTNRQTRTL